MNKYEQYWDGDPFEWTIAESDNFYIKGVFEEVELYRKANNERITCVGDFYGDPTAGIIDRNEKFCVTVGCGVIVYKLTEPFEEYMYDTNTVQWVEWGRDPDHIDWIESVRQISDDEVEIVDTDGNARIVKIDI